MQKFFEMFLQIVDFYFSYRLPFLSKRGKKDGFTIKVSQFFTSAWHSYIFRHIYEQVSCTVVLETCDTVCEREQETLGAKKKKVSLKNLSINFLPKKKKSFTLNSFLSIERDKETEEKKEIEKWGLKNCIFYNIFLWHRQLGKVIGWNNKSRFSFSFFFFHWKTFFSQSKAPAAPAPQTSVSV